MEHPRRNHHKLPKHYLRGFTDSVEKEFTWVYTKNKPYNVGKQQFNKFSPCLTSIRKADVERDFYAQKKPDGSIDYDSVEKKLEKLEQPGQPIIDKIRNYEPLSNEDRKLFAEYLMLIYKRVGYQRSDPNKNWISTKNRIFTDVEQEIEKELLVQSEQQDSVNLLLRMKNDVNNLKPQYSDDAPPAHILNSILFIPNDKMIDGLFKMQWTFVINNTPSPFLTSE